MQETGPDLVWSPSPETIREANITRFIAQTGMDSYAALERRADGDPSWFWNELIRFFDIRFQQPYSEVLDLSRGLPFARWCVGGKTNLVLNTLDKRTEQERARPAVIWESEDGKVRQWSYAELDAEVSRAAAGLAALGLVAGDVVGIYMPMVPETAAAFLAVAKIGCITLPLFSGFGAAAIVSRLQAGDAKAVITVDGTLRRGKPIAMKATVDEAAAQLPSLRHVIVVDRLGLAPAMKAGRDVPWGELGRGAPPVATAELDAEHPVMLLYTSGTTGAPKGTVHTHCGMSVKCAQDSQFHWNLKPDDRVLWISDMGWSGGSRLIASCLLAGATAVLVEGGPDYPSHDRLYRLFEKHRVTIFGLAPTLARSLRVHGDAAKKFDLSSLRLFISSAEPWDRESWLWLFETVGNRKLPIMNVSGGTEMGSMLATLPIFPLKPGGFHGPVLGTGTDIVDEEGRPKPVGELGELVMRAPCIGRTRSLWQDDARYLESYWEQIPGLWVQGDWASRSADGFWFLHGRSDDTIKVSGKRTGPAEIETILLASGKLVDAAVVGVPDARTGSAIVCVVVPTPAAAGDPELAATLTQQVARQLGASFRPQRVLLVSDLPRTRNLKVMRRVVRSVLTGQAPGDLSTLVNPEAVEELRRLA